MADPIMQQISCKSITWPPQERKRFGQEELTSLAETIRAHGLLEPIIVMRDAKGFTGLSGQRRWLAAEIAGLETLPAIVREKPANDVEATEIRLIENIAREGLTALEQATALDQLMKAGAFNASQAAQRVGMNLSAVSKLLALLQLPDPIRQQIDAGAISAAAGYELAKVDDPALQANHAAQIAGGKLGRDALAGKLKAAKRRPQAAEQTRKLRVTARLSSGRQVTVRGASLTVDSVITTLEELLSRCRSGRGKGLGLGTILRVLADEATRNPLPHNAKQ